jgi:hypothetical protein
MTTTNRADLAAELADLEATLATVRRDLLAEAGVLGTDDLPEIRMALLASLNQHAARIAGRELVVMRGVTPSLRRTA